MRFAYHTHGLDIETDFPCPGLAPAVGPAFGRPVSVVRGDVPEVMVDPVCSRPLTWIDRAGHVLHRIPGIARFMVQRGQVTVTSEPGGDPARLPNFLYDLPLLLQASHWGLLPLDATCVALGDGAVLIGGPPNIGRTSLALALTAQGGRVMADAGCVLETVDRRPPLALAAAPQVSVWPDSLPLPGLNTPITLGPGGRAVLAYTDYYEPRPQPVRAVVLLRPATSLPDPQRCQGVGAFEAVMRLARSAELVRTLLGEPARLAAMTALAAAANVLLVPYGPSRGSPAVQATALIQILRANQVL